MADNDDHLEILDDGAFTPNERKRLRRMLRDDDYARRFKVTIKVWMVTIGGVASALVAIKVLLWEYVRGLFR